MTSFEVVTPRAALVGGHDGEVALVGTLEHELLDLEVCEEGSHGVDVVAIVQHYSALDQLEYEQKSGHEAEFETAALLTAQGGKTLQKW